MVWGVTAKWLARVEEMLATNSWDRTWDGMQRDVAAVLADKEHEE